MIEMERSGTMELNKRILTSKKWGCYGVSKKKAMTKIITPETFIDRLINNKGNKHSLSTMGVHTGLKLLKCWALSCGIINNLVPGAGLEPARSIPGSRDFKSST
jgi:hypothetical protein